MLYEHSHLLVLLDSRWLLTASRQPKIKATIPQSWLSKCWSYTLNHGLQRVLTLWEAAMFACRYLYFLVDLSHYSVLCLPESIMAFSRWRDQQRAWTSLSLQISSQQCVNHLWWCSKLLISQRSKQQSPQDDDHFIFSSLNHWIFILLLELQEYAWDFDYIIIDSRYPGHSYNLYVIHLTKRHKILYWFLVSFCHTRLVKFG